MGVAHKVGSEMCYWLMPVSGIPVANTTVQHVTLEEMRNPNIQVQIEAFDKALVGRLKDTNHTIDIGVCGADIYLDDDYEDSYDNEGLDPEQVRPKADKVKSYDKLIGATFLLDPLRNADNVATRATVKERRKDPFGNPIGTAHANPLLDTREYVVVLEDGSKETYFANVIAENLWSQCNEEGREFSIFKEIVDHRTNNHGVPIADDFTTWNGRQFPKKTTAGGSSWKSLWTVMHNGSN
jgi:hypothetical protein